MADYSNLLAEIEALNQMPEEAPLSLGEQVKGTARGYLGGYASNFADNIESGLKTMAQKGMFDYAPFGIGNALAPLKYSAEFSGLSNQPTDDLYQANLNITRDEQDRFKRLANPALSMGSELVGSIMSPLTYQKKGSALLKLLTNPFTQGAASTYGAMDEEANLKDAAIGGVISTGASALTSAIAKPVSDITKQTDRLKTSAYGITAADVTKQVKKMGDTVEGLADDSEIPLVNIINRAEKQGIINAGDDALTNLQNVGQKQTNLMDNLNGIIKTYDKKIPPRADFQLTNTIKYIDKLEGTAKQKAEDAAGAELSALVKSIGSGSLEDLQRLKVGLNKSYDNPYSENVIKKLRSDIRAEIENRLDSAVTQGILPQSQLGKVRALNSEYGALEELQDSFRKRIGAEYGGDIVEDLIASGRTSGGTGTLNLAAAATGNPLYTGLSMLTNAARVPEAKSQIADALSEPMINKPLGLVSKYAPELITSKNVAQVYGNVMPEKEKQQPDISDLMSQIEMLGSNDPSLTSQLPSSLSGQRNDQRNIGLGSSARTNLESQTKEPLSSLSQLKNLISDYKAKDMSNKEQNKSILVKTVIESGISDPDEIKQFMAQMEHESGGFKHLKEKGSGAKYEGRKDLGNTQKGDGEKFKGRGFVQLTGRYNYKKYGDLIGVDLIKNPELAEKPDIAAKLAAAYWNDRVKPNVSDFKDIKAVTKLINGGYNGLADRQQKLANYNSEGNDILALLQEIASRKA